jgi:tyrosinase
MLKTVTALGALFLAGACSAPAMAQRTDGQPFVRRDLANVGDDGREIQDLRVAITEMKARNKDKNDHTNWDFQTNTIHGAQCEHGSYFFLAWHRMYLYYFERIIRKYSRDPNFSMPYWDYGSPREHAVPAAFLVAKLDGGKDNPLFTPRSLSANSGTALPETAYSSCKAFTYSVFSGDRPRDTFGGLVRPARKSSASPSDEHGALEVMPHDAIHAIIGGVMAFPPVAAEDPLFLVHHTNIDRLWQKWMDVPGHTIPDDRQLLDTPFTFYDEDGKEVSKSAREILDTLGQLNYRYEPPLEEELCPSAAGAGPSPSGNHPGTLVTVNKLNFSADKPSAEIAVPNGKRFFDKNVKKALAVTLDLSYYEDPPQPCGYFEVYVNLPQNLLNDTDKRAYHVGNLAHFDAPPGPLRDRRSALDITELLRDQFQKGLWTGDSIRITVLRPDWKCSSSDDGTASVLVKTLKLTYRK